jgi:hypothetical protein
MKPPLSQILEDARRQMSVARGVLEDAVRQYGWKDRIEHVAGLLTCGISTLHTSMKEIADFEVKMIDNERGPSRKFRPRGIGTDWCPGCYVCGVGEGSMSNIAAFVDSKEDGEAILAWFDGSAKLDFRPHEPNWIQVKVGACPNHLPCLEALYKTTSQYGVIRQKDIEDTYLQP